MFFVSFIFLEHFKLFTFVLGWLNGFPEALCGSVWGPGVRSDWSWREAESPAATEPLAGPAAPGLLLCVMHVFVFLPFISQGC